MKLELQLTTHPLRTEFDPVISSAGHLPKDGMFQ